jgi:DNA-binding NarL/FixJ family response regulator
LWTRAGGPYLREPAAFQDGARLGRGAAIALALGEPAPGAAAAADAGAGPLGPREAEVARLVAAGLSNKQIGTRLSGLAT